LTIASVALVSLAMPQMGVVAAERDTAIRFEAMSEPM
jgi:hypothetical protein